MSGNLVDKAIVMGAGSVGLSGSNGPVGISSSMENNAWIGTTGANTPTRIASQNVKQHYEFSISEAENGFVMWVNEIDSYRRRMYIAETIVDVIDQLKVAFISKKLET